MGTELKNKSFSLLFVFYVYTLLLHIWLGRPSVGHFALFLCLHMATLSRAFECVRVPTEQAATAAVRNILALYGPSKDYFNDEQRG